MPKGESWQGLGGAALGAHAAQAWDSVPSESDSLGAIISTRKGGLKATEMHCLTVLEAGV